MKRIERTLSVILLFIISLSNVSSPLAYAAEAGDIHINLPTTPSSQTGSVVSASTLPQPGNGTILESSTSLLGVSTSSYATENSAFRRTPIQMHALTQKVYQIGDPVSVAVTNPDNDNLQAIVLNDKGQSIPVPTTQSSDGTTTDIQLQGSNEIIPGKYTVKITDQSGDNTSQDFRWGVLALNTDKTMYHPGETADISMAVLNDQGGMVCDASMQLQITNQATGVTDALSTINTAGLVTASSSATENDVASSSATETTASSSATEKAILASYSAEERHHIASSSATESTTTASSTTESDTSSSSSNNLISVNPQCQKHDFSLQPDYEAHYTFAKGGDYSVQLTANTTNGVHTITDTIPVTDNIPFDVQRVSATRIYPPNTYPMTFNITAHQDFNGTITETVPQDFTITPATGSAQTNSYSNMQTMYINGGNPTQQLAQAVLGTGTSSLVMPFQGDYPITQGFGAQMTDPTLQAFYTQYGLAGHDGVDFGVPMNTPLYAVDDGNIIWSGPGDYGITIIIQHSWGETYYGHLSNTAVKVGDHVTKGQLIGYSGESGEATGPHLHFGMKPNNSDTKNGYYGKIDPLPYLPYEGHQPAADTSSFLPSSLQTGITPTPSFAPVDVNVLGASSSATASDSATPTPTATVSATPVIEPTTTPAPAVPSTQTLTQEVNSNFSVLNKQILSNEQLTNNSQTEKVKVITWKVTLKKGESTTLGYNFVAPQVSPQFYLLGPMQFYSNGSNKVVFQEQRQWEIASDDVGIDWFVDPTGRNFNGYSWQYRQKVDINNAKVDGSSFSDGFESGSYSNWNKGTVGSINTVQTGTVKTGTYAAKVTDTGTAGYALTYFGSTMNASLQADIDMSSIGSGIDTIWVENAALGNIFTLNFSTIGQICVWNGVSSTETCSQTTIALNTWHHYQFNVDANATQGIIQVYLDGSIVPDLNLTGLNTGTTPFSMIGLGDGNNGRSATYYVDNVNESAGTPITTFIDSGGDAVGTGANAITAEEGLWTSHSGTNGTSIVISSTTSHTGSDSLQLTSSAGVTDLNKNSVLSDTGSRMSLYVNFSSFPSSTTQFETACASGTGNGVLGLAISPTGVLQVQNNAGTALATSPTALSLNTWYRIDLSYVVANINAYSFNVFVNGTQVISYSQSSVGTALNFTGSGDFYIGWDSTTITTTGVAFFDDIYIDNGSDLTDPGDVHVTAKRPGSNGAENGFATQIGSGGSGFGSGHAPQVNERPILNTNGWSNVGSAATPTFDNAANVDEGAFQSSWTTPSFTVNSGHSNYYLMIALSDHAFPVSQPTVSYDGDAMTLIGSGEVGSTTNDYYLFGLVAPPIGTHTFLVTPGNGSSYYTGEAASWYNVNQTTPYGTFENAHNNVTSAATLNFTGSAAGRVVTDFVWIDATGVAPATGQTTAVDNYYSGYGANVGSSYTTSPLSGTTYSMSWTAPSNANWWGIDAVDLRGAANEEDYSLESASSGDVDISSAYYLASEAWMDGKINTGTCTASLINNGKYISETLSTTETMFSNLSIDNAYPSGSQAVGMAACTSNTSSLYEAGVQIAYLTTQPDTNYFQNFPVLVKLTGNTGLSSHAQTNCNDVVFTDSTGRTLLSYELESITATDCGSGNIVAWVKVPILYSDVDTIIYMYYGNPSAGTQQNKTGTWNSNYMGVWHLPEASTNTSIADSTSYASTSTKTSSGHPAQTASGQIGDGQIFASNDYSITSSSVPNLNFGANQNFTVGIWIKSSQAAANNTYPTLVAKDNWQLQPNPSGARQGWEIDLHASTTTQANFVTWSSTASGGTIGSVFTTSNLADGTWHYIVGERFGAAIYLYQDGAYSNVNAVANATNSVQQSVGVNFGDNGSLAGTTYVGSEDEVEISNVALSPGWITTQYNNQSSPTTFSTMGSQETKIYAPTMAQVMRHGQFFNTQGLIQPFTF